MPIHQCCTWVHLHVPTSQTSVTGRLLQLWSYFCSCTVGTDRERQCAQSLNPPTRYFRLPEPTRATLQQLASPFHLTLRLLRHSRCSRSTSSSSHTRLKARTAKRFTSKPFCFCCSVFCGPSPPRGAALFCLARRLWVSEPRVPV